MLSALSKRRRPFSYHTKMAIFVFYTLLFSWVKLASTQKSSSNIASRDSQIDKPRHGRRERAELPDVNTGAQNINTERASSKEGGANWKCGRAERTAKIKYWNETQNTLHLSLLLPTKAWHKQTRLFWLAPSEVNSVNVQYGFNFKLSLLTWWPP